MTETLDSSPSPLERLLRPASIAVVGASPSAGPANNVLTNLRTNGSAARLYAVNPKYSDIDGVPCYPSLTALPEAVDCAFIGVRAALGPAIFDEALLSGVGGAVINATDYASGGAEGRERLAKVRAAAIAAGVPVCGPNNLGFYNVRDNVGCWTLGDAAFEHGPVALITQSGTASMVLSGDPQPLGLSYVITCGDEAVTTAADYLGHVVADPAVGVVLLFIETIRNLERFHEAAAGAVKLGKKIVVLKVGRSEIGSRAVAAHTGGLAGEDSAYRALFAKYGIVSVRDMDEMIQLAHLLVAYPDGPVQPGFVPITMSGGVAALMADTAADTGVELPELTEKTMERIRDANPALSAAQNPLDAWGTGWDPDTFPGVLDALLGQADVGSIGLVLDVPPSGRAETLTALGAAPILATAAASASAKLIVINSNAQGSTYPPVSVALRTAGIPCLMGTTAALRAIAHWSRWPAPQPLAVAHRAIPDLIEAGPRLGAQIDALAAAGVPIVLSRVGTTALHAGELAEEINFPVALKAVHPDAPHKSDAGLVLLGLSTREQVERGFDALVARLASLDLDPQQAEIVVQRMEPVRLELIVGVRRMPGFGELVLLGLGGIYVEIFKRAAARLAPLDAPVVRGMLRELALDAILDGARGADPYDATALIDLILAAADVAAAAGPEFEVLELNPVSVRPVGFGAVALDVHVETTAPSRAP